LLPGAIAFYTALLGYQPARPGLRVRLGMNHGSAGLSHYLLGFLTTLGRRQARGSPSRARAAGSLPALRRERQLVVDGVEGVLRQLLSRLHVPVARSPPRADLGHRVTEYPGTL